MTTFKRVLGVSGGIDSQACLLWMRLRFPAEEIVALNSQAGRNECPITVAFIEEYSRTIFPVIEVVPTVGDLGGRERAERERRGLSDDQELTFDLMADLKGIFPSSQRQFCTEHLKLAPQRRWQEENLVAKGIDFERYVGVRRDESDNRREKLEGLGPEPRVWNPYFDCYLNYPLADWTKAQCFEFVREHGERWNPLYEMGFGRVGCAPCINSSKEDIRLWAARFPEMIEKIRGWEKRVGRTFFAPTVPGMELNWVDDVVKWSRTSRWSKRRRGQLDLPMIEADAAAGVCSSKYGLCE